MIYLGGGKRTILKFFLFINIVNSQFHTLPFALLPTYGGTLYFADNCL
jgi:hypothetical protein